MSMCIHSIYVEIYKMLVYWHNHTLPENFYEKIPSKARSNAYTIANIVRTMRHVLLLLDHANTMLERWISAILWNIVLCWNSCKRHPMFLNVASYRFHWIIRRLFTTFFILLYGSFTIATAMNVSKDKCFILNITVDSNWNCLNYSERNKLKSWLIFSKKCKRCCIETSD